MEFVTILILIDGFLQYYNFYVVISTKIGVTILILIDGFLQYDNQRFWEKVKRVTILILIDGFLQ